MRSPLSGDHVLLLSYTTPIDSTHSQIVIHTSAHPYCTEVWMTTLESGWNLYVVRILSNLAKSIWLGLGLGLG